MFWAALYITATGSLNASVEKHLERVSPPHEEVAASAPPLVAVQRGGDVSRFSSIKTASATRISFRLSSIVSLQQKPLSGGGDGFSSAPGGLDGWMRSAQKPLLRGERAPPALDPGVSWDYVAFVRSFAATVGPLFSLRLRGISETTLLPGAIRASGSRSSRRTGELELRPAQLALFPGVQGAGGCLRGANGPLSGTLFRLNGGNPFPISKVSLASLSGEVHGYPFSVASLPLLRLLNPA